jgi:hypothetical protein
LTISLGAGNPANAGFSIPSLNNGAVNLNTKNVAVTINKSGAPRDDIPLSYVHCLHQTLQAAGSGSVAIDVGIGANALTQSFKGEEWLYDDNHGIA